jgi:hypothetical protein
MAILSLERYATDYLLHKLEESYQQLKENGLKIFANQLAKMGAE